MNASAAAVVFLYLCAGCLPAQQSSDRREIEQLIEAYARSVDAADTALDPAAHQIEGDAHRIVGRHRIGRRGDFFLVQLERLVHLALPHQLLALTDELGLWASRRLRESGHEGRESETTGAVGCDHGGDYRRGGMRS